MTLTIMENSTSSSTMPAMLLMVTCWRSRFMGSFLSFQGSFGERRRFPRQKIAYSMVRMSQKPVTSKISRIISLAFFTFMAPC